MHLITCFSVLLVCVPFKEKSDLSTSPSGWHLGVALSIFLELINWCTIEEEVQGSLDICCSLSSLASWGLWINFPVGHQAMGHLVTTTPDAPQHYRLTEKSCYYRVSFKNEDPVRYSSKKSSFSKWRGNPGCNLSRVPLILTCNNHTDSPNLAYL